MDSNPGNSVRCTSTRALLWIDSKNAVGATLWGLLTMALVDFVATLWVAPAPIAASTSVTYFLLETGLSLLLAFVLLPLTLLCTVSGRLGHRILRPGQSWRGMFGPVAQSQGQVSKKASWLWTVYIISGLYLTTSTLITLRLGTTFKEPQLTALVMACAQLVSALFLTGIAALLAKGLHTLAKLLPKKLGLLNPLASIPAATLLLIILSWPLVVHVLFRALPQIAPLMPWRLLLSAGSFALGAWGWTQMLGRRGSMCPKQVRRKRIAVVLSIAVAAGLLPLTLITFGADPNTKALAISSSPTLASAMNLVRRANDFDGDGFGSLLGENDCAPFNPKINPLARDVPDNGIDENCDGRDFKLGRVPSYKSGEKMPVPEAFTQDWNFLFITIDTVRYDHTSMGGYVRDTTPRLKAFAERSANFRFAIAPSAGTMASVPAILTSKFFHSGIALDEDVPRGSPPRLRPSNTLLPELFKRKGYRTGAILSHEYFNDWGMDQGVDDYDNTVGRKRDPYGVTSVKLTDRAIAWIGKQRGKKWFLWVHYIDPHGRYVSHPGETNYGDTEKDIYDGELHFTDNHLGNLLDYVARSQAGNKTIITITSDHGDAFGEHGYINHAQDLHQEIVHVPLIFYVPNIEPRNISGAVSPIDLFPTLADLIGADIGDLAVEGESLVPQLFYGKDAENRTVFSETNYPKPLRAAVNTRYKLILDIKNNVSRLWNLKKDPGEKKNLWTTDKKGYKEMRGYLNDWLERVLYARDPESNQAIAKLADHLVRERPENATPVQGVSVANDAILIDSYSLHNDAVIPGKPMEVSVYFRVAKSGASDMKIQLEAWPAKGPSKKYTAKSRLALTAGGMFPTSRWHEGELVRDRFKILVPTAWGSEQQPMQIKLGLRFRSSRTFAKPAAPISLKGPLRAGTTDLAVIGEFTMQPQPPSEETGSKQAVP